MDKFLDLVSKNAEEYGLHLEITYLPSAGWTVNLYRYKCKANETIFLKSNKELHALYVDAYNALIRWLLDKKSNDQ